MWAAIYLAFVGEVDGAYYLLSFYISLISLVSITMPSTIADMAREGRADELINRPLWKTYYANTTTAFQVCALVWFGSWILGALWVFTWMMTVSAIYKAKEVKREMETAA